MPFSSTNALIPRCPAAGSVFAKTRAWSATAGVGDPVLLPVEHVDVALAPRARPEGRDVGAGPGFGEAEAGELLAPRLRDEEALLLLLGAVAQQRERVEPDVDGDQRAEGRLASLDLLAGERLADEVEPGAPVLPPG